MQIYAIIKDFQMRKRIRDYFSGQTASYTIALCAAVALFMALSNLNIVISVCRSIFGVLSPFVYAFAIAFVLNKPVMWFEAKVFPDKKHKKGLSIICVYIIAIVTVASLVMAVIPELGLSISIFIDKLPDALKTIYNYSMALFNKFHWSSQLIGQVESLWDMAMATVTDYSLTVLPKVLNFSLSLGGVLVDLLMILIISVYMLTGKSRLLFQFKKAAYAFFSNDTAEKMIKLAKKSSSIFSGFIIGKLIDSIIIGFMCYFGMLFINSDYTALISVIVGVTNMIPFFGPFIGAIPSTFILLVVDPIDAVIFAIFVFALQQFDGNILGPKILGNSLGISPIWVLAGILIGNGLFGLAGMLIGVPTFAVLYSLGSEEISSRLNEKGLKADYDRNKIEFNNQDNTLCNTKEN